MSEQRVLQLLTSTDVSPKQCRYRATGYNMYLPPAPCLHGLFLATPAHTWCMTREESAFLHHSKNPKSHLTFLLLTSYAVLPASSIRHGLRTRSLLTHCPGSAFTSLFWNPTMYGLLLTPTQTDLNYLSFCCTRSRMRSNVQTFELMLLREHRRCRTSM